jgi:hypothetical protein
VTFDYAGSTNFEAATASAMLDDTYRVLALFNETRARQAGSPIPIQIELATASGQDVSSASVLVTAEGIAATTDTTDLVGVADPSAVGTLSAAQDAGGSNSGDLFREQGGAQPFYMFNLVTSKTMAAGTYRLYFAVAGDPLWHWVTFAIK